MDSKCKVQLILLLAGFAAVVVPPVNAGDLQPPGPPDSTMKTIDEVEPRVPIHADDLPLTITESNSYYLTGDIGTSVTPITVEADDVTIDLMGYKISLGMHLIGPDYYGIYINDANNVKIRNGTIRNFDPQGIYATYGSGGISVIDVRAISNSGRGIWLYGQNNLVENCLAADNGDKGIEAGSGSTVTGNTATNNANEGIKTGGHCIVTGNTATDNGDSGIETAAACVVTGNNAGGNHIGISADYGTTITENNTRGNLTTGIWTSYGSTVTGNTAASNDGNGIRTGTGSTVTGNTAYYNTGYGIYTFDYCLIDRNTAYHNGDTNLFYGDGCQIGLNLAP